MPAAIDAALRKFHASLNVSDLDRSVAFYRTLLGTEPAKQRSDYAKFDIAEPPLVLSLIPGQPTAGGNLNHVGLRVRTAEELVEIQRRLEAAGLPTQREDGVECCYARQTKFWISDPDRALWEVYVFHEDIAEHGHGAPPVVAAEPPAPVAAAGAAAGAGAAPPRLWQHRLHEPIPSRIPFDEATLHDVRLEGTMNVEPTAPHRSGVMADAFRTLRPGASIHLRGLSGDRPSRGRPALPGPAAAVEHVPSTASVVNELVLAGFVDIRIEKLSQTAHFVIDGVQMRELRVSGRKPAGESKAARHHAIYLGPMAQVIDDFGNVFRRGAVTSIDAGDWEMLSTSAARETFVFLGPEAAAETASCCGSRPAPTEVTTPVTPG